MNVLPRKSSLNADTDNDGIDELHSNMLNLAILKPKHGDDVDILFCGDFNSSVGNNENLKGLISNVNPTW